MNRLALAAVGVTVALIPAAASAEAVRLEVDGGFIGQGWLFRDPLTGFCGVVTAAHVVAPGGTPRNTFIIGEGDLRGVGADVRILSPPRSIDTSAFSDESAAGAGGGADIALMRVEGGILQHGCTSATLGSTLPPDVLAAQGQLERITEQDDRERETIDFLDQGTKDDRFLSVRPANPSDHIEKGFSGSPIIEARDAHATEAERRLPIAMVIDVADGDVASAVRFNYIKQLVDQALASSASRSERSRARAALDVAGASLVDWGGDTADLACPPTNAVNGAAACGWRAKPIGSSRSIWLTLHVTGNTVSHVRLDFASGAPAWVQIETATAANADDWNLNAKKDLSGSSVSLDFLPAMAPFVKITAPVAAEPMVEVRVSEIR